MLTFVYFGRLTYDKGIDIILDTFSAISQNPLDTESGNGSGTYDQQHTVTPSRQLHIYGQGPYTPQCIQAAQKNPNIIYHGRATLETIHETLKTAHYCLTPSRVIETFGKSALEALQFGLPIIGFKKGGLAQFISDEELIIDSAKPTESLTHIIASLISTYKTTQKLPDRAHYQKIAKKYSQEAWIQNINNITHNAQIQNNSNPASQEISSSNHPISILYVSDFISKIGGIETFLHESRALLQKNNYRVALFGSQKHVSFSGLLETACNIRARFGVRKVVSRFKPNIIRYHSLFRKIGRTAIVSKKRVPIQLITIHDLGHFHPYPAQLYDEKNIPPFTLHAWISYGKTPLQKVLIFGKFMSFFVLQKHLKPRIDTRCVPSEFIVDILHFSREIPKEKIVVLPHFTA